MHLSLAKARLGADNITHHRYPRLRLATQFGRCFVLSGTQQLAVGTTWEAALENLLSREVIQYVTRNNLDIAPDYSFTKLAQLYLDNPAQLLALFPTKSTLPTMLVKPVFPAGTTRQAISTDEIAIRGTVPDLQP